VRDTKNNQDIMRLKQGGNVEIPNGKLDMNGNNIQLNGGYLSNDGNNEGIRVDNSGNVEVPSGNLDIGSGRLWITPYSNYGSWQNGGTTLFTGKSTNFIAGYSDNRRNINFGIGGDNISESTIGLSLDGQGDGSGTPANSVDVRIPNGLAEVGQTSNSENLPLRVKNGGSTSGIRINANGNTGDLTWNSGYWNLGDGAVRVGSGNLKLYGQDLEFVSGGTRRLGLEHQSGSNRVSFVDYDQGAGNVINFNEGGNVEIPNGNLDVSSPSNSDHTVDVGGSMGVEGTLDVNGNDIRNVDALTWSREKVNGSGTETFESASFDGSSEITGGDWGTWTVGESTDVSVSSSDPTHGLSNYEGNMVMLQGGAHMNSTGLNLDKWAWSGGRLYISAWVRVEADAGETGVIQFSNDGGSTWQTLEQFEQPASSNDKWTRWQHVTYDITDLIKYGNNHHIQFDMEASGPADTMYIDNVRLIHAPSLGRWTGSDNTGEISYRGGTVEIPNGNLDMNGNNITSSTTGNVSIGQSLKVYGNVYAQGADLAEIYQSPQKLDPGEVVAINTEKDNSVVKTERKYQETVTGVVSTNPGQTLNWDEDGYPIALEGKVPVQVKEGVKVERGDRLVPSNVSGKATVCETWNPLKEENSSIRRIVAHNQKCRSSTIGKALESSEAGNNKVLVKAN
ncbi:MAG: hypothetical protein ABEJ95_05525, partial [Candidatus Nanohalobium sp.]